MALSDQLEQIGKVLAQPPGYFSPVYQIFINSDEWRAKAKRITKKFWGNAPECDACGYKELLEVHHKIYPPKGTAKLIDFINQPEDRKNFALLCRYCHNSVHKSLDARKGVKRRRTLQRKRRRAKK